VAETFTADVRERLAEIESESARCASALSILAAQPEDPFQHVERHTHTLA